MDTPREIQDRCDRLVRELFSVLMNKSQIRSGRIGSATPAVELYEFMVGWG
jgi:hypothetical protein